jgi:hypothetical protein
MLRFGQRQNNEVRWRENDPVRTHHNGREPVDKDITGFPQPAAGVLNAEHMGKIRMKTVHYDE